MSCTESEILAVLRDALIVEVKKLNGYSVNADNVFIAKNLAYVEDEYAFPAFSLFPYEGHVENVFMTGVEERKMKIAIEAMKILNTDDLDDAAWHALKLVEDVQRFLKKVQHNTDIVLNKINNLYRSDGNDKWVSTFPEDNEHVIFVVTYFTVTYRHNGLY